LFVIQPLPRRIIAALRMDSGPASDFLARQAGGASPTSLLTITLASNFGTFVLYALSCVICMVAYHNHPKFNALKHLLIPVIRPGGQSGLHGLLPDRPFMGIWYKMEPLSALGIAMCWAIFGGIYFVRSSKKSGRTTFVESKVSAS